MKRIFLLSLVVLTSCNMSDETHYLPSNYSFQEEGGYSNIIVRNHKLIIDHGAFDYSVTEKFIMLIYDTADNRHSSIENQKLFYLVHDIRRDSLMGVMNYVQYKEFIKQNGILPAEDLSIRDYSKYLE